jgi:anti-sigma-K factor RskA
MKQQRSYSDPEIACYVLGLDLPEQAQGIQALLAHDDAAAARALKWEAYLLSIVDALPATPPPDEVLQKIEQTLGMTFEAPTPAPVLGESRTRSRPSTGEPRQASWPEWLRCPPWLHGLLSLPKIKPRTAWRPSKRAFWIGVIVGLAIVALAALLISASLHTAPRTVVNQTITTEH